MVTYAAKYWHLHLKGAKGENPDLVRMTKDFLCTRNANFYHWAEFYSLSEDEVKGDQKGSENKATPMYFTALFGFLWLVEHSLIEDPMQVHIEGRPYGTPLVVACFKVHLQVVALLVSKGADVAISNREG